MILKKPYAFIIKHFRLIHLMLLIACVIFVWDINHIHVLINKLYSSGTFMYIGSMNYVHNYIYLILLVMLALSGTLFIMLGKKKKPTRIYLLLMIFSIVSLIAVFYIFSNLKTMESKLLDLDTMIFLNDITFVIQLPTYFFIAICFIRGIGFNLKQFNFSKDIEDLDIADKDSEEFEFMMGQNNYKYFRTIRRFIRETKYYILENQFSVITITITVSVLVLGIGIYNYTNNIKALKSNETTAVNGIVYSVNYSFLTANDYLGKQVKKGHKFVIVNMSFYNTYFESKSVDLTKIFLYDGKNSYIPSMMYNSKFYDFGEPYIKDRLINVEDSLTATLCFELPNTSKSSYELRIQYGIDEGKINKYVARYKKFKINALNVDKKDNINKVSLREYIGIDLLGVNKFNIKINSYKLDDIFENKYIICENVKNCNIKSTLISARNFSNMTLLQIDYNGLIYDDANFARTLNTFNKIFDAYTQVEYVVNGKTYVEDAVLASDSEVDNKAFLVVPRKINNATSINLIFNFRNDKYVVELF